MKFTTKYFIYTALAGIFATNQIKAQVADSAFVDINYIRKSNAWLSSKNAAGLSFFNTTNISDMSVYYSKDNGGFKNYFQSNDSQEYGIKAESFSRLNKKVVLAGGFAYKNFSGKNMTGSAFINPYESPFDIVELDAGNRGTKELELYHLDGAVAAQLSSKLSIGGKINYEAGNYAKRKDLRHINKLLNMDLSIGALYQINKTIEIGANYEYNRRIESLSFKTFGNTDKSFLSLISFGSFYGNSELFSQYGYTSSSNSNPLKDIRHGGSLQLNINFDKDVKLFNEFSYNKRDGFFGIEGTSSILLTKHNGKSYAYNGTLSIIGANNIEHHINLKGSRSLLSNFQTIYRKETTTGGVSQIVYYGQSEVFSGANTNAGLDYNIYLDVKNNQPNWAINFTADYFSRDQSTNLYPFYRNQKINSLQFLAQVNKQIQRSNDAFNVGLGIGYGKGGGNVSDDGVLATPSSSTIMPTTMVQFLNEEFEYFTAARYKANVNLKYTKALQNNFGVYVKLNATHNYAPNVNYLGKHFSALSASLGCNF